jgi:hypothetical protein
MKRISLGTLFTLLIVLSLASAALAETTALPGSGWWSGEQIQNVGSSTEDVFITAYDSLNTNTYETSSNLDPGESYSFLPWSFTGLPDNFQGSALVSSLADIRAVVNVTVKYNAGQGVGDPSSISPATGQYQGVVVPDTAIYFPMAKNDHFDKTTNFAIQNAGTAPATALATFKLPNSNGGPITTYTYTTPSIEPNKMVIISPSDAGAPSGDGIMGSLTVTSVQPLAGTSMEFITGETHPTVLQTMRAFTEADFDTKFYAPIVKDRWSNITLSRNTGIQVQNVSGGLIDIDVTYKGNSAAPNCANGTYLASYDDLENGASANFLSRDALPDVCLGAATIEATGNILAIVSESYSPIPAGKYQEATAYNGFPESAATTVISIPMYKENSFAKTTGVSIMNVGLANAVNVVAKFIGSTGTYVSDPFTIPMGGNEVLLRVRNKPVSWWNGTAMTPAALGCAVPNNATGCGSNGIFGVIITADQPIVAIANETYEEPFFLQDKNNYEGFNLLADPTAP